MKNLLINETNNLAYWVEITTETPPCIYYFGPFINSEEAQTASYGYVEDLNGENAQNIKINIKHCQPDYQNLTIF